MEISRNLSDLNKSPNVVLLVLDSVRADRFVNQKEFSVSTPCLNELAEEGIFFDNAYSTGSWTVPAHGSLFTGKLPSEHGAHAKHKYFSVGTENTLPGVLSSIGYTTAGFSTNPWISDEFGFTRGFDEFYELRSPLPFSDGQVDPRAEMEDPSLSQMVRWVFSGNPFKRVVNGAYTKIFQNIPYAPAGTMNNKIIDWISNSSEEPFFLFANYMDAHEPYMIRNEFIDRDIDEAVLDFDWNLHCYKNGPDSETFNDIRTIYDSSISYLDHHLSELINNLDLEETLLIVVGDHGQSLGEENYWGHGTLLSEELVHVPLFIHAQDISTDLSSATISLSDIPQIVYDYLDDGEAKFSMKDQHGHTGDTESELVVAESFGPHQEVDSIPNFISESGYRILINREGYMLRNLDNDEITIHSTNKKHRISKSRFLQFEKEVLSDLSSARESEREEIDGAKKRRLENLGYL